MERGTPAKQRPFTKIPRNLNEPLRICNFTDKNAQWGWAGGIFAGPRQSSRSTGRWACLSPRDSTGPRDGSFAATAMETKGITWLYLSQ